MSEHARDENTPSTGAAHDAADLDPTAVDDLFDRTERRDRVVQLGVVLGCAALCLVRPASLATPARVAYHLAIAGLAGASTASGLTREPFADRTIAAGGAAAAVGTVLGLVRTTERLDERLHTSLVRGGISHPRAIIAGIGLVAGAGSLALDRVLTTRRRALVEAEAAAATAPAGSSVG